jgi:hypothetical protein
VCERERERERENCWYSFIRTSYQITRTSGPAEQGGRTLTTSARAGQPRGWSLQTGMAGRSLGVCQSERGRAGSRHGGLRCCACTEPRRAGCGYSAAGGAATSSPVSPNSPARRCGVVPWCGGRPGREGRRAAPRKKKLPRTAWSHRPEPNTHLAERRFFFTRNVGNEKS